MKNDVQKLRLIIKLFLKEITLKNVELLGYEYTATAILYMLDMRKQGKHIEKMKLYKKIAEMHNVTESSVERALRSYVSINQEEIRKYFKTNERIRSSEFLVLLCDEIEMKLVNKNKNNKLEV